MLSFSGESFAHPPFLPIKRTPHTRLLHRAPYAARLPPEPQPPRSTQTHHVTANTATPTSLPYPVNRPVHHFSTVIYPNSRAVRTPADDLDTLVYGRCGSPSQYALEAALVRLTAAHGALLTTSKMAALAATTTPWVRAGDCIAAPANLLPDAAPVLHALLPRLGVRVLSYASRDDLLLVLDRHAPRVVLLQAPAPPSFLPALRVSDVPAVRAQCTAAPVFVLDNFGACVPPADVFQCDGGVDIMVASADRFGGAFDGNSALIFGLVACRNESVYRKTRFAVRGHMGPAGGSPSPDDAERALFSLRSALPRRAAQLGNAQRLVAFLGSGALPGLCDVGTFPGCLDVRLELEDVDRFLDGLRLIRIGDGVGGGNSTSFAWPCWAGGSEYKNSVILSVGLEDVEDLKADMLQAAANIE